MMQAILSLFAPIGMVLAFGCQTPKDGRLYLEPEEPVLNWDDLIDDELGMSIDPQPWLRIDAELTAEQLAKLPSTIRDQKDLAKLAVDRFVHNAHFYHDGVYTKLARGTLYFTSRERIGDFERLYWVMIKVLSEKYGCFIKRKLTSGDRFLFHCRDGRQVAMWRSHSDNWLQFYARQYDREGQEIRVVNRILR